jgi:hypothetical protein
LHVRLREYQEGSLVLVFVVTNKQLQVLSDAVTRRFEERLSRDIAARFPASAAAMAGRYAAEADPVLAVVRQLLKKAEAYAIERSGDLAVFVALAAANHKFTEPDKPSYLHWTSELLGLADADGQSRIALIEHEIGMRARKDPRAAELKTALVELRRNY